jgi:DNA polymerase III epsilon subunit-like protein
MSSNFLRFKNTQKYIVWDFETNGLNLRYVKPWQLSFLICEGKDIKEEHDYYLHWDDLQMSKEAAEICRFDMKFYLSKAESKEKILNIFNSYLYNEEYISVGHNLLGYDTMVHNALTLQCGGKSNFSYIKRLYDTLALGRCYKSDQVKSEKENILEWQYKWINYRKRGLKTTLKDLADTFDIKYDPTKLHNSLYDIKLNFEIFNKIIWKLDV